MDYMGINKHFELPVSLGSLGRAEEEALIERSAASQQVQRLEGRSTAIAT